MVFPEFERIHRFLLLTIWLPIGSVRLRLVSAVLAILLLTACASSGPNNGQGNRSSHHASSSVQSGYICRNASRYRLRVIGKGHCVSLIRHCSPAPFTRYWQQGKRVKGRALKPGTVIANFRSGKYPNKTGWHAAIYISQDEDGIWVWDQWVGKPVHKRLIRFKDGKGTPNNDGDAYYVVR